MTNFFAILCLLLFQSSIFAQSDNLEMGTPAHEVAYERAGYSLGFNPSYHQAAWVSYKLTAREVCDRVVSRDNFDFKADSEIAGSSDKNDYPDSKKFQRGHLAPAADMRWSEEAMKESFLYTNACPQRPAFNTGIWSKLETVVRNFAVDFDSVYIVTGPVLKGKLPKTRKSGKLAVAKYFFKVILSAGNAEPRAIGFVMANEGSKLPVEHFAVTVDSVEHLSGLDFFSTLPDSLEDRIESAVNLSLWKFNTKNPCPKKD
jgi:endonuclease G